jgi:Leucine rich repeat variant
VSEFDVQAEAANPSTPPDRLAQLARHRDRRVRETVVANPNLAFATLDAVGLAFPEALARNPLLNWLAVEDPDFLTSRSRLVRERLLAVTTNSALMWWASRYGSNDDRRAVLANGNASTEIVTWLLANGDEAIVALARVHVACPDGQQAAEGPVATGLDTQELELLAQLGTLPPVVYGVVVKHGTAALRSLVVAQSNAPASCLSALLVDDEPTIRSQARTHTNTPADFVALVDGVCDLDGPCPSLEPDQVAVFGRTLHGIGLLTARADLPADLVESFIASEAWRERELIAASPSLSESQIRRLAVDNDSDVRAALAGNPLTSAVVTTLLASDREEKVRRRAETTAVLTPALFDELCSFGAAGQLLVAAHPDCPVVRLAELARTEDWRVREACAQNLRSAPAILELLSHDADVDVRRAVARNPNTPEPTRERLATDSSWTLRAAVAATTTNPSIIDLLMGDPEPTVRAALLRNPIVPPFLIAALAHSSDVEIARELAQRDAIDPSSLLELARLDDDGVRSALAVRADRPDGLLARLLDQRADLAPLAEQLLDARLGAARSSVPHDATDIATDIAQLFEHAPWLHTLLLDVDDLPIEVLEFAVGASNWITRQKAARSSSIRHDLLARLAADNDHDVRSAVAANSLTSTDVIAQLATDNNSAVKLAVIGRRDVSAEMIERFTIDPDDAVRNAALAHPLCPDYMRLRRHALDNREPMPPEWFASFMDTNGDPPLAVATHPDTPPLLLAELASNPSWRIREAVAAHAHTPVDALATLAADADRDVRRAAAAHPNLARDVREALAIDPDPTVRRVALVHPAMSQARREQAASAVVAGLARSTSAITRTSALASPLFSVRRLRARMHRQSLEWTERYAVALNPSTDVITLEHLSRDGNRLIRDVAQARLDGSAS